MPAVTNQVLISEENEHGCFNYAPLPVVLEKGEGCIVTDVEGKEYIDGLAGYSAVNQGHCHPRLVKVMQDQCAKLTLTSRAFHNNVLPKFCTFVTEYFGYDRVLPMNSGVEAGESAVKIMRRWSYEKKGIPSDQAIVIFPKDNFWGRSIAACSASTDPDCRINYGPFMPGFVHVPYDDVDALKSCLEANKGKVAGFYVEPIQGEAGVKIPQQGYLKKCQELLHEHGALLCCDEIQSGLYRSGKKLASDWDECKPDVLVLGKALAGGMMPVSCVLGSNEVMEVLTPGSHGSTYGGNPLGMSIAIEALKVLEDDKLGENSMVQGEKFRQRMRKVAEQCTYIKDIRGRGLFNAVEINEGHHTSAAQICKKMLEEGLLAKPTHSTIIRFTPPLCITDAQLDKMASIAENAILASR